MSGRCQHSKSKIQKSNLGLVAELTLVAVTLEELKEEEKKKRRGGGRLYLS